MKRNKGTEPQTKKHWSMKEVKLLLELTSEGFTHKEIADHLGRSEKAVQVKIYKLRSLIVPTKKPPKKKIDLVPNKGTPKEFVISKRHVVLALVWSALTTAFCVAILLERLI